MSVSGLVALAGEDYLGNAGILEARTLGDGVPVNVALVLHVLDNVEEEDGFGRGRALLSGFVGHGCCCGGVSGVDGSEGGGELQADEVSDNRTVEEAYLN